MTVTTAADEARRDRGRGLDGTGAVVDIRFEGGVPVSVNGVPMPPAELIESLSLIAGQHGVGRVESTRNGRTVVYDAPAAAVLHAARAALGEPNRRRASVGC